MEHLSIVALGDETLNLPTILTELVTKYECTIIRARIATLGNTDSASILAAGNKNSITKLELALQNLAETSESDAEIFTKLTKPIMYEDNLLPYAIQITGMDEIGVANEITAFFNTQNVKIDDMYLETGNAHTTNTPLFTLNMVINIPSAINLAALREEFISLCDKLNIDGMIEADKRW